MPFKNLSRILICVDKESSIHFFHFERNSWKGRNSFPDGSESRIQCVKCKFALFPSRICLLPPSSYSFNHCRCLGTITLVYLFALHTSVISTGYPNFRLALASRDIVGTCASAFQPRKRIFRFVKTAECATASPNNSVWIFATESITHKHTLLLGRALCTYYTYLFFNPGYSILVTRNINST